MLHMPSERHIPWIARITHAHPRAHSFHVIIYKKAIFDSFSISEGL